MERYIIGASVVIIGTVVAIYNQFKSLDLQAEAALSNIDVALSKRYDTLTNMVEVVKGYAAHEKEVLIKITEVRGHTLAAINETDTKQSDELSRILALAEAYPNLKADQNFLHLQRVIADVEEHLQAARRLYNQSVKEFNKHLETFPSRFVGSSMKLTKKEFYTASSEQKENVKIKL